MIRYSEETTRPLLQKMFQACPLQAFLDAAEDILQSPVSFVPSVGNAEGCYSKGYPEIRELSRAMEQELHDRGNYVMRQVDSLIGNRPKINPPGPGVPRKGFFCWAVYGGQRYGLVGIAEKSVPLEEIDPELVTFIASCIAEMTAVRHEPAPLTGDELLGRLLRGEISTALELSAVPNLDALTGAGVARRILCLPLSYQKLVKMGNLMQIEFHDLFSDCWCAWNDEAFYVMLDTGRGDIQPGGRASARLKKAGEAYGCPICVGPVFDGLLGTRKLSRHMLSIPDLRTAEPGALVYYEEHLECSLVCEAGLPPEELRALCSPLLAAVRDYDAQNGTEYLNTLRVYLNCHLNASQTARVLCIHPNTAAYRLNRMQELFDFDLLDANTLFNLMLSLRLTAYADQPGGR